MADQQLVGVLIRRLNKLDILSIVALMTCHVGQVVALMIHGVTVTGVLPVGLPSEGRFMLLNRRWRTGQCHKTVDRG